MGGIIAGLSLTHTLPPDFKRWYFGFLTDHADPASGYFRCSDRWPQLCGPNGGDGGTAPPGENKSAVILVHDMSNYEHVSNCHLYQPRREASQSVASLACFCWRLRPSALS